MIRRMGNPPGYEDPPEYEGQDDEPEDDIEDDREPEDFFDDDICGPLWSPQPRD